jgi:pimeloyl-ACP methyl ester carboxylesterase
MSAVSGHDWEACRAVLDGRLLGTVAQAVKDADTFFGVELPALTEWAFGHDQAAAIQQPVLSLRGAETEPLWVEVADRLRAWLPQLEDHTIDGVGHLLHIQNPGFVAQRIARFLGRNSITAP